MKFDIQWIRLLNSEAKLKITGFLLTREALMSEREIASVLKVSPMSVNRTLRELSAVNFANYATIGNAHLWKVNRKSCAFRVFSKIIGAIDRVPPPLDDLKTTIVKHLPRRLIRQAVMFGPVARGGKKPDDRIDIFVGVKNLKAVKKMETALKKLSAVCLEKYGNSLSPRVLTGHELKRKKNSKLRSAINKGVAIFVP